MKVQITVVVTPPGGFSRVESTTLLLTEGQPYGEADKVVANAARQVARRAGLGKPTPEKEGGRG